MTPPVIRSKRAVFVSYHHHGDGGYYDQFVRLFQDTYSVLRDNSVDREIDSDDAEYVIQTIRDDYLTGSSCTIVLCGRDTPWRKFVDWEIKATLDKEHALVGVNLPANPREANGLFTVPDRLFDNIDSGYAVWTDWSTLASSPDRLGTTIEKACGRDRSLIRNARALRRRNGLRP